MAQARYGDAETSADGASAAARFEKVLMLMGWMCFMVLSIILTQGP